MSRGRALRTGVAFDQRTGFKVRGRRLVEDGERPGVLTTRDNADQAHPQRFVRVPPPDGLTYRPGPPAQHSIGARVDLSWVMASDTHVAGSDTQQSEFVLRKSFSDLTAFCGLNLHDFFFGELVVVDDGPFLWGDVPMLWGGVQLQWSTTTGDPDPEDHPWDGIEFN